MTEAEYRAHSALNQSRLKQLEDGAFSVHEDGDPMKRLKCNNALVIGSAVDCLVTDPESWISYHVVEADIPTPQNLALVETCIELKIQGSTQGEVNNRLPLKVITEAYERVGVRGRGLTKILEEFQKEAPLFKLYEELLRNYNKTWLCKEDFALVNECAINVCNHPYTRDIFKNDREHIYQKAIVFEHLGVECKALLDILQIDHVNMVIYPYDLKTTGKQLKQFKSSIFDFGYDIQARWYEYAIRSEYAHLLDAGYTIAPFTFIVVSKKDPSVPIQVPLTFLHPEQIDRRIDGLIQKYLFYEANGYGVDMDIVQSNGVLPVVIG